MKVSSQSYLHLSQGISNFRHQNASKTENIASESTHTKSYKSTTDVASPFSTFTNSDAAPIQTPDDNLSPRNSSSTPMKIDNSEFLSADRDTPWKNNCSSDTADLQSTKEEEYLRILFSTDEVLSRLSNVDGNKKRPLATKRRSSVSHKDVAASNKMDASQVHDILEQSDNILSYLQSATTSPNISSHHRTVSLNHSESPSRFGLAQPYSPNASASSRSNIPRHLLGEQNHFERSQQTQVHVNKDNTEFSRSYPQLSNSATLSAETKSFVRFVHPLINLVCIFITLGATIYIYIYIRDFFIYFFLLYFVFRFRFLANIKYKYIHTYIHMHYSSLCFTDFSRHTQ